MGHLLYSLIVKASMCKSNFICETRGKFVESSNSKVFLAILIL